MNCFEANVGKKRFELNDELKTLEEGRRDYRVVRGLAHLLAGDHSTFATGGRALAAAGPQPGL